MEKNLLCHLNHLVKVKNWINKRILQIKLAVVKNKKIKQSRKNLRQKIKNNQIKFKFKKIIKKNYKKNRRKMKNRRRKMKIMGKINSEPLLFWKMWKRIINK